MRWAIWYHLYNFKNVKIIHGGVLLLVKWLKPATLLKVTLLDGCFSLFLNYTDGINSRNASYIVFSWICRLKTNIATVQHLVDVSRTFCPIRLWRLRYERMTLLNKIKSINCSILEFSDAVVTKILLFGDNTLSDCCNTLILNSTIDYIISTKIFDDSILTPG